MENAVVLLRPGRCGAMDIAPMKTLAGRQERGKEMKYKLLLTGTNSTLLNEFFIHMEFTFECMCSSIRADDLQTHLKYFKPDALVFCLYSETQQKISILRSLERKLSKENIPLIICGEDENCDLFEKTLPFAADLVIRQPFTAKTLEERIVAYLHTNAAKKEKAEEKSEKAEKNQEAAGGGNLDKDLSDILSSLDKLEEEVEKRKHILVVDDDSNVLKLVKRCLSSSYNVATAINGKVALKFLEKKDTDLILLDYEMPGKTGAEVLEELRASDRTKNLPVIFLTGMMEKKKIQEVLSLNPQGYLLKPINMTRLSNTVKEVLGE